MIWERTLAPFDDSGGSVVEENRPCEVVGLAPEALMRFVLSLAVKAGCGDYETFNSHVCPGIIMSNGYHLWSVKQGSGIRIKLGGLAKGRLPSVDPSVIVGSGLRAKHCTRECACACICPLPLSQCLVAIL